MPAMVVVGGARVWEGRNCPVTKQRCPARRLLMTASAAVPILRAGGQHPLCSVGRTSGATTLLSQPRHRRRRIPL